MHTGHMNIYDRQLIVHEQYNLQTQPHTFLSMFKHGTLAIKRIQIKLKYLLTHGASTLPYLYPCNIKQQGPPLPGTPMGTNANLNFKNYTAQYGNHSKAKGEFASLV
jgi:hypothetical protein